MPDIAPADAENDEVLAVEKKKEDSKEKKQRDGDKKGSKRDRKTSKSPEDSDKRKRRRRDDDDNRNRRDSPNRRPRRSPSPPRRKPNEKEPDNVEKTEPPKPRKVDDALTKAGGAYIPPAKLRAMQEQIQDKTSDQYQRLAWERLKKKIHGDVNKVNVGNIQDMAIDLFKENIVRGKGLLARSIMQAQDFSPTFSHVYAALVAIINTKFPQIGELIAHRLIIQFKNSFRRNDKQKAVNVCKFIAHLINQQMIHEVLALEILTLLLENASDDSVEIAIGFLKECGAKLSDVTPRGMQAIFDRFRSILHDAEAVDKRVQYMIEVAFHIRKDKFSAYPTLVSELDLVEEEDQITHTLTLEDARDPENILNIYRYDPDYEKNEEMYEEIKKEILGEGDDDEDDEDDDEEEEEKEEATTETPKTTIIDKTQMNMIAFRRTIYLTIHSSLDYQEAAHKLLKIDIQPGLEMELCHMFLDCCSQQRTYEKFYGLLCERFCRLRKEFQANFEQLFKDTYSTIHRFEIMKLRNVARMFSHLLFTDAISWEVLSCIRLSEEETTSAGRIFIKIVFQELSEFMGMESLYERIRDPTLQIAFDGIFPRDNPKDSRFAINFFTSIGLGGLTVDLRDHLKSGPVKTTQTSEEAPGLVALKEKMIKKEPKEIKEEPSSESDSSDSSGDSSSSSDDEEGPPKKATKKIQNQRALEKQKEGDQNRQEFRPRRREPLENGDDRPMRSPPRRQIPEAGVPSRSGEGSSPPRRDLRRRPSSRSPPRRNRSPPQHRSPPRRRRSPALDEGRPPRSPPRRVRSPVDKRLSQRSPPGPRRGRSPPRNDKRPSRSPPRRGRSPINERQSSRSPPRRPDLQKEKISSSRSRRSRDREAKARKSDSRSKSPSRDRRRVPSPKRQSGAQRSPPPNMRSRREPEKESRAQPTTKVKQEPQSPPEEKKTESKSRPKKPSQKKKASASSSSGSSSSSSSDSSSSSGSGSDSSSSDDDSGSSSSSSASSRERNKKKEKGRKK